MLLVLGLDFPLLTCNWGKNILLLVCLAEALLTETENTPSKETVKMFYNTTRFLNILIIFLRYILMLILLLFVFLTLRHNRTLASPMNLNIIFAIFSL